jgi:hypothetical protein
MYIHIYIHTYIHTYIHIYLHTYIFTYIYRHLHNHICIYIHTCIYIYIYICTHIYIQKYRYIYLFFGADWSRDSIKSLYNFINCHLCTPLKVHRVHTFRIKMLVNKKEFYCIYVICHQHIIKIHLENMDYNNGDCL